MDDDAAASDAADAGTVLTRTATSCAAKTAEMAPLPIIGASTYSSCPPYRFAAARLTSLSLCAGGGNAKRVSAGVDEGMRNHRAITSRRLFASGRGRRRRRHP